MPSLSVGTRDFKRKNLFGRGLKNKKPKQTEFFQRTKRQTKIDKYIRHSDDKNKEEKILFFSCIPFLNISRITHREIW